MKTQLKTTIFVISFCFLGSAQAAFYQIEGKNSVRGPFHGVLQAHEDGTVTRVVEYDQLQIQGLKVQEVWQGKVSGKGVQFQVSHSQFVTKANETKMDLAQATKKTEINLKMSGENLYTNVDGSKSSETMNSGISAPSADMLAKFQRSLRDVSDKGPPFLVKGIIKIAKNKINFDSDPFVKEMKSKPECKDEKAKVVVDKTDQEFYSKYRNVVRVYNSPANALSLAEGLYRRSALVSTSSADWNWPR